MMLGHHGKDPTLPVAKSTAGPTRQTSRTDTNTTPHYKSAIFRPPKSSEYPPLAALALAPTHHAATYKDQLGSRDF